MEYCVFSPSATLEPLVKCYWTLESGPQDIPQRQRIVPDGCQELIFHYGDLYRQYFQDKPPVIQPRCFVMGQLTEPLDIEALGQTGIFAVRFWPDGVSHFVGVDPEELANTAVAIDELWGGQAADLEDAILTSETTAQRIELVERFLIDQLGDRTMIDRVLRRSVESLYRSAGQCSIADMAESLDISAKHLERKFRSKIGLTPKKLARLIRMQATLRLLMQRPDQSLTAVAIQGQYFDQSHFIREFREFTGMTPKQFFGDRLQLTHLFHQET